MPHPASQARTLVAIFAPELNRWDLWQRGKGDELALGSVHMRVSTFLEDPSIQLTSLREVAPARGEARRGAVLRAAWVLRCGLRLPWRPWVEVIGSTEYELCWPGNNRIVRHVEAWDINGWEALVLVFTPGGVGRQERRGRGGDLQ